MSRHSSAEQGTAARPRTGPTVTLRAPRPPTEESGRYRLLLDPVALARLKESARLRTPAWTAVSRQAEEALAKPVASGYQGFEWADALASTTLAWHATGEARYAEGAIRYLGALLDDRFEVGDRKGGKDVVTHDSGYGIRT